MSHTPVLSVLDLSVVGSGSTPADALAGSTRLAKHTEALGYHRYWVAEHHSMPGIASSQPAVLIAHLAAHTSTLRLGSGGVMLPNHSPLVVAEQFGMLEALHPDRIDLGLGRAPGTDGITAAALRRHNRRETGEEFPQQLGELLAYFNGGFPDDHPFAKIRATPAEGYQPNIWLLGSSDYSATLAGQLGLPFSFAHHFAGGGTDAAVAAYRHHFRPSAVLDEPYLMLGANVLCAPTDDEAAYLARPAGLSMVRLRTGRPGPFPTPEEAEAHPWTDQDLAVARSFTGTHIIGNPATVRREIEELVERTGADEIMITTMSHSTEHRLRSYSMVAEAMELRPRISS